MLDQAIIEQLRQTFATLKRPVVLHVNTGAHPRGTQLAGLAESLADTHPLIRVDIRNAPDERPRLSVGPEGEAPRIHFAGAPMGHEFTSLVLAILHSGGHPPKVDEATRRRIETLSGNWQLETWVSLSCHNCPEVVQALNLMAALNPGIKHTMLDGAWFEEEVEARQILAVPAVFLGGEPFSHGRKSLEELLAALESRAPAREAAPVERAPYDVLVVGGGPAGVAAAIYAARKGIRTGLVAERFGGQVMDTLAIENLISVPYTEGPKLGADLREHVSRYGVELITGHRVTALDAGSLHRIRLSNGETLSGRTVILAPGARWRELGVPGEQTYRGKGVAYCPHCDGPLFKGKRVAVIGGGNSGIEAAIDLAGITAHVTVLEYADSLKADAVLQDKARSLANVDILTGVETREITGEGGRVNGLVYRDRTTGKDSRLPVDGVFVQIGLAPNTDWLRDTPIALNRFGEIEVNERGETGVPGIFAAGDATTAPYKQIVIAMGSGATAALSAFDYLIRQVPRAEAA